MAKLVERIGGFRRYLAAAAAVVVGAAMAFWPGGIGGDAPNRVFVAIGATIAVVALGWVILTLDRQISDNPRYERPVYKDDEEDPGSS